MTAAAFGPAHAPGLGLDSVIGHEAARAFLAERVRAGALPHALLLSGPRGVGKRTLAQALVARHFCAAGSGCGRCADCGALRRGNHAGYVEVAGAADRPAIPIDAIQRLAAELSLRPPDGRGRIAVILGAERMTAPAQDALLKTLEEPPPGNVLVLTAARHGALTATLRSRCQRLALVPLADAEVEEVARRLGLELAVPVSVAAGCPGLLAELADPGLDRLRRGVARLLADERGRDDVAKWIVLLHDGLSKEAEPADVRARARQLLRLCESLVRDAVVLRAAGAGGIVRNADLTDRLRAIAARPEWGDAIASLGRLARARDRIEGNVDPASALACALDPAPPTREE